MQKMQYRYKGSFHHQVAQEYRSISSSRRVFVFEELVEWLCGRSEQAVMAIENSIAGAYYSITL
jgi:hypothetical protein